jgi:hypothetical protein
VATLTNEPVTSGHPGRWRALAVSQIAAFMALLDVSIVNVALPSIERDLGASPASVRGVVSDTRSRSGSHSYRPGGSEMPWGDAGCSWSACRRSW